jgi:hypothetical protein
MAYYPLSYFALWFLFRFNEDERALGEPNKLEEFLFNHTHVMEWTILVLCAFVGFVFFVLTVWLTVRKYRRLSVKEEACAGNLSMASAVPQLVARPQPVARPATPRPAASAPPPQVKKVPKKPSAPPASDNPFDFS